MIMLELYWVRGEARKRPARHTHAARTTARAQHTDRDTAAAGRARNEKDGWKNQGKKGKGS